MYLNLRLVFVVSLTCLLAVAVQAETKFLSQNWNEAQRQEYYTLSQGSRIMPYEWFLALENEDDEKSFLRTTVFELGYLPNENTHKNPDKLPVGFAVDVDLSGRKHFGLNCAACHTNQISHNGTTYQIDGGPTLADIWGLLEGIDKSLTKTVSDSAKFERFAKKVLGEEEDDDDDDEDRIKELRTEVTDFLEYWSQFIDDSRVDHPWGRARLDAFGMIFNRVTSIDLGIPENSMKPDAPVSYPFLWGTSWEDRVQWNGSAENENDIERLGRNIGEVLGVFAQAEFRAVGFRGKFVEARTSAKRLNQVVLENHLKRLWSPEWPQEFGEIDEAKKAAGKVLFDANCKSCHEVIPHGMQHKKVVVEMTPLSLVKTDPKMAENASSGIVSTGDLSNAFGFRERMPRGEVIQKLGKLSLISPYRDVRQNENLLFSVFDVENLTIPDQRFNPREIKNFLIALDFDMAEAKQVVAGYEKKLKSYYQQLEKAADWIKSQKSRDAQLAEANEADVPSTLRYKARPLDGIWATAPYLHNGSVPNLYELLLPAEERSKTFHVGSKEFDPKYVGFKTDSGPGTTLLDTTKPGNSNSGHDMYGTFNEEERWQLVEYMKSL